MRRSRSPRARRRCARCWSSPTLMRSPSRSMPTGPLSYCTSTPALHRRVEISLQDSQRADVAVGGAEAAAHHTVEHDRGVESRDVVERYHRRLDESRRALDRDRLAERRELVLVGGEKEVAHRLVATVAAGCVVELRSFSRERSDSCTLMGDANWARNPPVARPGAAGARSGALSRRITDRQPSIVRCQATLAPMTPAPTITTSAERVTP